VSKADVDVLFCACPLPYVERMRHALLRAVDGGRFALERIDQLVRCVLALMERYAAGDSSAHGLIGGNGTPRQSCERSLPAPLPTAG
jgi:hypothetical protein